METSIRSKKLLTFISLVLISTHSCIALGDETQNFGAENKHLVLKVPVDVTMLELLTKYSNESEKSNVDKVAQSTPVVFKDNAWNILQRSSNFIGNNFIGSFVDAYAKTKAKYGSKAPITTPYAFPEFITERELAIFRKIVSEASRSKGDPSSNRIEGATTPAGVIAQSANIKLWLQQSSDSYENSVKSQLGSIIRENDISTAMLSDIFKHKLDTPFTELSKSEQLILLKRIDASLTSLHALEVLEREGIHNAWDALCNAATAINQSLPDDNQTPRILCLINPEVRDNGSQEQYLKFVGIHLSPLGYPPQTTWTVPIINKTQVTATAGGSSSLSVQLSGGMNGTPSDTTSRIDVAASLAFKWDKDNEQNWFFQIKPYLVGKAFVSWTPLAEQWVDESIEYPGAFADIKSCTPWDNTTSAQRNAFAEPGYRRKSCSVARKYDYSGPADAWAQEIPNEGCMFGIWATSSWCHHSHIRADFLLVEQYKDWLPTSTFEATGVVNSGSSTTFVYPEELLGGAWTHTLPEYNYKWRVFVSLNDGTQVNLDTTHQCVKSSKGAVVFASVDPTGKLTVNFPTPAQNNSCPIN
ncbi:hypothetical protein [Ferriphaselus sp. R-1]|uniref:hypothetical protein n=1 Tax=Ferriphaselus sp. R-1 TaxID=1485544 RepID=UPI001268FE9E|nr:hypothetical protein [Ferriphaselus sp. R-1]